MIGYRLLVTGDTVGLVKRVKIMCSLFKELDYIAVIPFVLIMASKYNDGRRPQKLAARWQGIFKLKNIF